MLLPIAPHSAQRATSDLSQFLCKTMVIANTHIKYLMLFPNVTGKNTNRIKGF